MGKIMSYTAQACVNDIVEETVETTTYGWDDPFLYWSDNIFNGLDAICFDIAQTNSF